jgi:hypothetical protein
VLPPYGLTKRQLEANVNVVNLKTPEQVRPKKRKSGIPTGNAGEYFVMGELLRRGYDAQLADRNTAGYDLLVGRHDAHTLTKVQVKTVRAQPWFVKQSSFEGAMLEQVTIYVMIGNVEAKSSVRYFVARNADLVGQFSVPPKWDASAFMPLRAIVKYENCWETMG